MNKQINERLSKLINSLPGTKNINALQSYNTIYSFNLVCSNFRFAALPEGICATLNLHIQAVKLYIYYSIDIHLKDVIFALSWEARK